MANNINDINKDIKRYEKIVDNLTYALTVLNVQGFTQLELDFMLKSIKLDRYQYAYLSKQQNKFLLKKNRDYIKELEEELISFKYALRKLKHDLR